MFGRRRGGRGRFINQGGSGQGWGGNCVCPNCGYSEVHQLGQPCFMKKCPSCGTHLVRTIG